MRMIMLGLITVVLAVAPSAQTPSPSGTVDVTAAELQAVMKLGVNSPMKSIDAGKHTVFFWYESRKPGAAARGATGGALGSEFHTELTEIYLIVGGSAVLRTGGTVISRTERRVPGELPGTTLPRFPSPLFSVQTEGGVARKVSVGDMLVIPPNTPHRWESIDPPELSYVIFRVDPEHRLHPGYVNPALKK